MFPGARLHLLSVTNEMVLMRQVGANHPLRDLWTTGTCKYSIQVLRAQQLTHELRLRYRKEHSCPCTSRDSPTSQYQQR